MAAYHKFVFDTSKRIFIGNFEEMYKNEELEHYDSWYQENLNEITKRISKMILDGFNFNTIIDVGCGKGLFTSLLKKQNNKVIGIDSSPTAVEKAKARFPEITWKVRTISELNQILIEERLNKVDLIVYMEILSYIEDWPEQIKRASGNSEYLYISLNLPDNPIGFVKSASNLESEFSKFFLVLENVSRFYPGGQIKYLLGKRLEVVK